MHEHDLDLIAAFAEGSLEDESVARALVETCSECRAEYDGQQAVLAALATVPEARMSDIERAGLHRDLWTDLRAAPAKRPVSPWWYRWSYVAAGLFVVVGLVGVLGGQFGMGGDSAEQGATFSEIGSGLGPTSEEAPNEVFGADDGALDSAGGESTATTSAASEATTTAAAEDAAVPPDFAALAATTRDRKTAGEVAYQRTEIPADVEDCLRVLGLQDLVVVESLELDKHYVALMEDDSNSEVVTFVSVEDCQVAAVDAGPGGG